MLSVTCVLAEPSPSLLDSTLVGLIEWDNLCNAFISAF